LSPLHHSTEFLASQRGLKELWSTTEQETNLCHKFCNKIKYVPQKPGRVTHQKQDEKYICFTRKVLKAINNDR